MKRRWLAFFASITLLIIILSFWLKSAGRVRVQFIGITNNPSLGPVAIMCVTNQAVDLIICGIEGTQQVQPPSRWSAIDTRCSTGLAYLERGESYPFAVRVPAGTRPWRLAVRWQRQDLTPLEGFINLQHTRLLVFLGEPNGHRDAWAPFAHTIYSPEISR